MKSCNSCFWCRYAWHPKHKYKCKIHESKLFDKPKLNGMLCKAYMKGQIGKLKEDEDEL